MTESQIQEQSDGLQAAFNAQRCYPNIAYTQAAPGYGHDGEFGLWIEFGKGQHQPAGPLFIIPMSKREAIKLAMHILKRATEE